MLYIVTGSFRDKTLMRLDNNLFRFFQQFPKNTNKNHNSSCQANKTGNQRNVQAHNWRLNQLEVSFSNFLSQHAFCIRTSDLELRKRSADLVRSFHEPFHLDESIVALCVTLGYQRTLGKDSEADVAVVQGFKVLRYLVVWRVNSVLKFEVLWPVWWVAKQRYLNGQRSTWCDVWSYAGNSEKWKNKLL